MPSNESRSSSFLSEATKMSTSANTNDDAPEDSSLFKFYIENGYVLPLELKNDIIYCQRAMRDFLKVHGLVSDVFKEQADADPVQMQRILDELEAEVYEINAEQQFLMLRLDHQLDTFYKNLEENNIRTVPEMANEYISSLIVPLIGDANYKIYPQSVLSRDSEEMLIRKHFLISQDEDGGVEPLKLSELDDNVPLMLVNALSASATATASATVSVKPPPSDEAASEPKLLDEKIEYGGGLAKLSPSPSPSLMQTQLQTEEALSPTSKKEQLHSLLIPRGSQPPEQQDEKLNQLSPTPPPPPPPPPPLVASKQRAPRADAKQAVKRILTSPPPLAPITKTPLATDFEEVAQSRMNLRQALRRARKTKQQPRQFDEEDVLELPVEKVAESPPQPSTAPTKSKPVKAMEATATAPTTTAAVASTSVAAPAAKKSAPQASSKQYKTRNAHGAGRKPATPPLAQAAPQPVAAAGASSGSSGSSDDSHQELELEQQRLCASAAQWRDEPRETRVLPAEYGREHFLGLFGLYTHDMVKKLCQRHSKRKRRTVQNASGVDFHYGQQLTAIDAVRQKKLKDKPEFLLSPKDKRLQAKKAHKANAAAVAVVSNRKSKSKTPEKLEDALANGHSDVGKHKCKECKKRADNFLTCQSCHGHYHLDCHEEAKGKTQSALTSASHAQLSSRCPPCLRDWMLSTGRTKGGSS
ncbi:serine/arginine repetitive matrix protein 1 isoform X1 [Drosophila montana]|uniref:serine/arginine repetitive matrix protein 1 isoform X1 n=1 Tax=Drosophila montana TaxID=40370 RepID=UPI00313B230E